MVAAVEVGYHDREAMVSTHLISPGRIDGHGRAIYKWNSPWRTFASGKLGVMHLNS